jgi:hypothetical protein
MPEILTDRHSMIARLREMAARNRSLLESSRSVRDVDALTGGVYEVVTETAGALNVEVRRGDTAVVTPALNVYAVRDGRCGCPDFRATGDCVHARAVELVETGQAVEPAETVTTGEVPTTAAGENIARERENDRERARRRNRLEAWQARYGNNVMLSRDDEAFARLYNAVKGGGNIQYEYEDVLAGSQNTFGVEIEFIEGYAPAIARDLQELGLGDGQLHGYHSSARRPGMWTVERDGSVSNGNRGGEVVSPVLTDCRETWEQIEKVCEVIKLHGGKINRKCGSHVHICADPLDSRSFRWNRLVRIYAGFEDVLYRMAAGGQSKGRFRGSHYARPFASLLPSKFFGDRQTDEAEIKSHVNSRYHGLNFLNANPGAQKNTLEFRLFNGTLDPKQIQTNVRIAMGIVHAAEVVRRTEEATRDRNELIPREPMGFGQAARSGKDPDDHTEVRRLLDIIFVRSRDKAAALWLYASSRWQQ